MDVDMHPETPPYTVSRTGSNALSSPVKGGSYSLPQSKGEDSVSIDDRAERAGYFVNSLPRLIYQPSQPTTQDTIASGRLVHMALIEAGLTEPCADNKLPKLRNPYPGTFSSVSAFLDFAHRVLTAMARWESGMYQNDDSMVGLMDMALLDQDSKSIADKQERSFYTPPGYLGWKHHKSNEYIIHSIARENPREEACRKVSFFRDITRCRHSMFIHHDGTHHWTGLFVDHVLGRILYFDSMHQADTLQDARKARVLLAEFFRINSHPSADKVGSWEIELVTGYTQKDGFSCGPAVAEFFRTIYREGAVGVHQSSYVKEPAASVSKGTDALLAGWSAALRQVLNIDTVTTKFAEDADRKVVKSSTDMVTDMVAQVKESLFTDVEVTPESFGGHLGDSALERFRDKNWITPFRDGGDGNVIYILDATTLTLQTRPAGRRSQQAAAAVRTETPSGGPSGMRFQSPINLETPAGSRGASPNAAPSTPADIQMAAPAEQRKSLGYELWPHEEAIYRRLLAAQEALRRTTLDMQQYSPGAPIWFREHDKLEAYAAEIRALLEEIGRENDNVGFL